MESIALIAVLVGAWWFVKGRKGVSTPKATPLAPRSPAPPTILVEEKDSWEGSFWDVADARPAKARLELTYVDGAGQRTRRQVEVRQFGTLDGTTLMIGHCHLRQATRSFRADRVEACVDLETGEDVSDLRGFLEALYRSSPDAATSILLATQGDLLRILVFVGKADGALRAKEREVIARVCQSLTSDARVGEEQVKALLAQVDVPTLQGFRLAVGRLQSQSAEQRQQVITAAEQIVATQATVHPAEAEALAYLKQRLRDV